ncbi:hypothetical protein KJ567_01175, partial [Candidatus Bipolaricaulota bacterium]|nr:hypothetical protein [Candidatus Bipolaricaulota bacterium]
GHGIHGRPATRIPQPGMTLAFLEARVFQTLFTNDVHGFGSWTGELIGYHARLGFFNVAYADGHAAYADFGDGTYYEQTDEFGGYDQRGSWGRWDCLPEPPLPFCGPGKGAGRSTPLFQAKEVSP